MTRLFGIWEVTLRTVLCKVRLLKAPWHLVPWTRLFELQILAHTCQKMTRWGGRGWVWGGERRAWRSFQDSDLHCSDKSNVGARKWALGGSEEQEIGRLLLSSSTKQSLHFWQALNCMRSEKAFLSNVCYSVTTGFYAFLPSPVRGSYINAPKNHCTERYFF